jgi:electron-transferring-flavoprotein dehydrogenase
MEKKDQKKADLLIVGAGPGGLACAITAKKEYPGLRVRVIDKSPSAGAHNLSGAALEPQPINNLMNLTVKNWQEAPIVKNVLGRRVAKEQILMLSQSGKTNITAAFNTMSRLHLPAFEPFSLGDYIVSISKLTRLLACIAENLGVEVLWKSAGEQIQYDNGRASGVWLREQGNDEMNSFIDTERRGELLKADCIVLAEGCDGYLTEQFIDRNALLRKQQPLFAIGVKEVADVSPNQFKAFGGNSFLRLHGYPFWRPLRSPSILGFGLVYPVAVNRLAVTAISSLNWRYPNYSPQDALTLIKEHPYISRFFMGGDIVESGAKMIPHGGYYSIPFDRREHSVGKDNVVIVGDSAGFYDMRRQKGIGNAIISGMSAGMAVGNIANRMQFAPHYTQMLSNNGLLESLKRSSNYRPLSSRAGTDIALTMSRILSLLPFRPAAPDNKSMTTDKYSYDSGASPANDEFVKKAGVVPSHGRPHVFIKDLDVCKWDCMRTYECPCLRFCPAGVFERVLEHIQPKAAANCLHCKLCQRKCPYDNISWLMPPGGSGPGYNCS